MDYTKLQATLGYQFKNLDLLLTALMHRSFVHEHHDSQLPSNERLEFLGDALLNFITGQFLYHSYPEMGEGQLTNARSALVQTATLADFARRFGLGSHVRLSKGEERAGARKRDNLLADTFEAVLAAIALDSDWQTARDWMVPLLKAEMEHGAADRSDYKSDLQRRIQGQINITPAYREVSVTGPDHDREWTIEVLAGEVLLGVGVGRSKPSASQAAARNAIQALDGPEPPALPSAEVAR
jgi:ribonuclease-3